MKTFNFDRKITSYPHTLEDGSEVYTIIGTQRFENWFFRLFGQSETTIFVPKDSPVLTDIMHSYLTRGRFLMTVDESQHHFFVRIINDSFIGICSCGHQSSRYQSKYQKANNVLMSCWCDMLVHVGENIEALDEPVSFKDINV